MNDSPYWHWSIHVKRIEEDEDSNHIRRSQNTEQDQYYCIEALTMIFKN